MPGHSHNVVNFMVTNESGYKKTYRLYGTGANCEIAWIRQNQNNTPTLIVVYGISVLGFHFGVLYPETDFPDKTVCYTVKYTSSKYDRYAVKAVIPGQTNWCPEETPNPLPDPLPGWTGGEIAILRNDPTKNALFHKTIKFYTHRLGGDDWEYTYNPRVGGTFFKGTTGDGVMIGPSAITQIDVEMEGGPLNVSLYPGADFTPTPGVIPCYDIISETTIVKGKKIDVPDPTSSSGFTWGCEVTTGSETPSPKP